MAESKKTEAKMARLGRREQTIINYMKNGGNMKRAMIDAGYSETYADRNSKYLMGIIGDDIKKVQDDLRDKNIKSVKEVQRWWSSIIDDESVDRYNRMRASEDLVKSQGGFIQKVETEVKSAITINIELDDD